MTKLEIISTSKQLRKDLDDLLQRTKDFKKQVIASVRENPQLDKELVDSGEVIAQITLSQRDVEGAIMRQGMALKYTGNPDPYPNSKNPESSVVEPTADGLKM